MDSKTSLVLIGFTMLTQLGYICAVVCFQIFIWFHQRQLLDIFVSINYTARDVVPPRIYFLIKSFIVFCMLSFTAAGVITIVVSADYRNASYMGNLYCNSSTFYAIVQKIGLELLAAEMRLLIGIPYVFLVLVSACILTIGFSFENKLASCFDNGIKDLTELRRGIGLINESFGNLFFFFYVSMTGYYCTLPEDILRGTFSQAPILCATYLVFSLFVWLLNAEFHYRVKVAITKWKEGVISRHVSHNETDVEQKGCDATETNLEKNIQSLTVLDVLLNGEPLGVSCRFFTVTYSFVGSVSLLNLFCLR